MATLGVADRWADLAIASWSLGWNFGPGWDETFYQAYGVGPTPTASPTTACCGSWPVTGDGTGR